jgi:hypothetical protein
MWIRRLSDVALAAVLAVAPATAWGAPSGPAATRDDPLVEYRSRFKLGMDRYKAGALAEAIGYWEPVYRELGAQTGYRLAYDLGIAYGEIGDATRAIERLQAFVDEAEARRLRGETLEPIVEREETDARARIAAFTSTRGRIRVEAGTSPLAVQIDGNEPRLAGFIAWVTPGTHSVTFAPGTPDAESVSLEIHAGEVRAVVPSPPATPHAAIDAVGRAPPPLGDVSASPAPEARASEIVRPFGPPVLYVSGGLTVAATVTAIVLESEAASLHEKFSAEQQRMGGVIPESDRGQFATTRTWAYAAVGGSVGLAAVTAGLCVWYFLGASRNDAAPAPALDIGRHGASASVTWRF